MLPVEIQKYDFYNIIDLNVGLVTESTRGKKSFQTKSKIK